MNLDIVPQTNRPRWWSWQSLPRFCVCFHSLRIGFFAARIVFVYRVIRQ